MVEYWRELEKKPVNYRDGLSSWRPKTGDNFPAKWIVADTPMVHNHWCLPCGREYFLHLNGTRYTRLDRGKLSQIVVAMHIQGYIKVDVGCYVLTRGRYERTVRFHNCIVNAEKVWVVSSVR